MSRPGWRRVLMFGVLLAVVATNTGLWLVSRPREPDGVDAFADQPAVVRVESRVVSEVLKIRCAFAAAETVEWKPSVDDPLVVTADGRASGEAIRAGEQIAEVGSRPVFVLQGRIPMHRTLIGGMEGPDVEQLQTGLSQLGAFDDTYERGVFDESTKLAVARFYQDAGYEAALSLELEAEVPQAELEVRSAELQRSGAWGTARELASLVLDQATARLEEARVEAGPIVPTSELIFAPSVPVGMMSAQLSRGEVLTPDIAAIELASGQLSISCPVTSGQLGFVSVGQEVEFSTGSSDLAKGDASEIATSTDERGQTAISLTVEAREEISTDLLGVPVVIEIVIQTTDTQVTAVPLVAVTHQPDGTSTVTTGEPDGLIAVQLGVAAGGWVEVIDPSEFLSAGTTLEVPGTGR